jgi:hypothetical protein
LTRFHIFRETKRLAAPEFTLVYVLIVLWRAPACNSNVQAINNFAKLVKGIRAMVAFWVILAQSLSRLHNALANLAIKTIGGVL